MSVHGTGPRHTPDLAGADAVGGPSATDAAEAATRAKLHSIDVGYEAYERSLEQGATPKAKAALKEVGKLIRTTLFDWKVTEKEKQRAVAILAGLSPKEFFYAVTTLNGQQLIDPLKGGYHTRSGFLFEPARARASDAKLSDLKAVWKREIHDPDALKFAVDVLDTQRKKLWVQ